MTMNGASTRTAISAEMTADSRAFASVRHQQIVRQLSAVRDMAAANSHGHSDRLAQRDHDDSQHARRGAQRR